MPTSLLFGNADTDIVLRSSDDVDFHIDLAVLVAASTVFEDMSTFPTPTTPDSEKGHAVVPVDESSATLELLLQLIHPGMQPDLRAITDLDLYRDVLRAADKYQMPKVVPILELVLVGPQFLDTEAKALRMFVMASQFGTPALVHAAARALLAFPPLYERKEIPELKGMSATQYHRLLNYRRRCVGVLFREKGPDISFHEEINAWWSKNFGKAGIQASWPTCYVCQQSWFREHLERIKGAYTRKVTADSAASVELLEIVLRRASVTTTAHCCRSTTVAGDLVRLSILLAEKVEKGLAEIKY